MNLDGSFVRSIKQLKHPVLFVPDISLLFATIIFSLGFFKFSGLNNIVNSFVLAEGFQADLFKELLADRWVSIVVGGIIFFVTTFMLGVGADVLRFNLIREIVLKQNKVSLSKAWKDGKGVFWDVVGLKLLVYLLSLVVLVVILLFGLLLFSVTNDLKSPWLVVPTAIFGLVLIVLLKLHLLFRYPILFVERHKEPMRVIKESFTFARKRMSYVFMVALVLVVSLVGFSVITAPIPLGLDYAQGFLAATAFGTVFVYVVKVIKSAVNLFYGLWAHIFVFNAYLHKKK